MKNSILMFAVLAFSLSLFAEDVATQTAPVTSDTTEAAEMDNSWTAWANTVHSWTSGALYNRAINEILTPAKDGEIKELAGNALKYYGFIAAAKIVFTTTAPYLKPLLKVLKPFQPFLKFFSFTKKIAPKNTDKTKTQ